MTNPIVTNHASTTTNAPHRSIVVLELPAKVPGCHGQPLPVGHSNRLPSSCGAVRGNVGSDASLEQNAWSIPVTSTALPSLLWRCPCSRAARRPCTRSRRRLPPTPQRRLPRPHRQRPRRLQSRAGPLCLRPFRLPRLRPIPARAPISIWTRFATDASAPSAGTSRTRPRPPPRSS
jgi:hypothetical protein